MGLLSKLIRRRRGVLAEEPQDSDLTAPHLVQPQPTPTTKVPERPHETPTTRRLETARETAGTPSYRTPHGTPSTQRIHNPSHPGR
jgi:hypothetical protein